MTLSTVYREYSMSYQFHFHSFPSFLPQIPRGNADQAKLQSSDLLELASELCCPKFVAGGRGPFWGFLSREVICLYSISDGAIRMQPTYIHGRRISGSSGCLVQQMRFRACFD